MTLLQLSQNLKKLNLNKIYKETIQEFEPEIIDLNTSQLEVGKDSTGSFLPEYEYEAYGALKRSLGSKSGNHYDLKLEGDFIEAFFTEFNANLDLIIDSKDSKRDRLVNMTSNAIFGLTDENKTTFVKEYFLPTFLEKLRKQIGIN